VTVVEQYEIRCAGNSDIVGHLPYLHARAAVNGIQVVELGVRSGESTCAFLAAAEEHKGHVWSVDIDPPSAPPEWFDSDVWTFIQGDDLDPAVTGQIPAKFDLLFISDGLVMDPGDHPSFLCRFEPTTLISVLSASTRHIGLGATVSTSFGEPYHVARTFASIDHLSKGRAAWNVVTSSAGKAALNFSRERHMEHDLRYEVANEFVDVVKGLWDCWDDGAILADKTTGAFLDPTRVHPLNHKGRFFRSRGR
jgi:hypothetical protein